MRVMKRIKKITLLLLLGGFVAMLSLVSAGDASAQRRARRNSPTHPRIIRELPQGYGTLQVDGMEFYHYGGVFYRKVRNNFTVVRAPRGALLKDLPTGYATVPVSEKTYFRYNNVFYTEAEGGYAVTTPPFGKSVDQLPQGYETLASRGDVDLYFQDGLVYRADPESDTYTIVNPQRRTRTGRGAARFSTAGRRGGSQFDRFRYRNSRRSFTPGRMRRGSRY